MIALRPMADMEFLQIMAAKIFENIGEIETYNDMLLFMPRQITEKHGGKIRVEPRENGNSFIFQSAIG